MYTKQIFASGAFIAAVAAVPMNKRDMVMVTETDMAYVTVPVTTTVWVDASESSLSTKQNHYGHHKSHKTTTVLSTIVVQPTAGASSSAAPSSYEAPSSSSSSVYVAPTTASSSSVYVAPTTSSVYVAPTTSTTSVYVAPTTSSVYVAPTTSTTSVYVAPTTSSVYVAPTTSTTSVYVAPTTSSAAPSAYSSAASSSSSSGESSGPGAAGTSYKGDLTWYQTGLGSCGWTSGSSDKIVALSHVIMDAYDTGNSNTNPMCGKMVTITGKDGSPYQAKVVDRCVGCAEGDLDLSEDFFNTVTENGDGRVPGMSWSFN